MKYDELTDEQKSQINNLFKLDELNFLQRKMRMRRIKNYVYNIGIVESLVEEDEEYIIYSFSGDIGYSVSKDLFDELRIGDELISVEGFGIGNIPVFTKLLNCN